MGPAAVIIEVIEKYQLNKPLLYGYDWGGAIVLKLSTNKDYAKYYSKVIAFMPYYGDSVQKELATIQTEVLIQWIDKD